MKICSICYDEYRFDIICERCHKTCCLQCFSKLDRCAFCRKVFGAPSDSKWNDMIGGLNMSIKRLYDLGLVR